MKRNHFFVILINIWLISISCNSINNSNKATSASLISDKGIKRTDIYLTAKETTDRLTKKKSVDFIDQTQLLKEGFPYIIVDYKKTFQIIEALEEL